MEVELGELSDQTLGFELGWAAIEVVSAEIVVHKGPMDDADPLAFEAWALSDLLVNQVSPPK